MNPEDVPAEMVERAAAAMLGQGLAMTRTARHDAARHALAAVLPEIQAQALREAADAVPVDLWATFGRADRRVVEGFKEWLYSKAVQRSARLTTTTEGATPTHVGGQVNAEDCPACSIDLPPYPWICPGPNETEGPTT